MYRCYEVLKHKGSSRDVLIDLKGSREWWASTVKRTLSQEPLLLTPKMPAKWSLVRKMFSEALTCPKWERQLQFVRLDMNIH